MGAQNQPLNRDCSTNNQFAKSSSSSAKWRYQQIRGSQLKKISQLKNSQHSNSSKIEMRNKQSGANKQNYGSCLRKNNKTNKIVLDQQIVSIQNHSEIVKGKIDRQQEETKKYDKIKQIITQKRTQEEKDNDNDKEEQISSYNIRIINDKKQQNVKQYDNQYAFNDKSAVLDKKQQVSYSNSVMKERIKKIRKQRQQKPLNAQISKKLIIKAKRLVNQHHQRQALKDNHDNILQSLSHQQINHHQTRSKMVKIKKNKQSKDLDKNSNYQYGYLLSNAFNNTKENFKPSESIQSPSQYLSFIRRQRTSETNSNNRQQDFKEISPVFGNETVYEDQVSFLNQNHFTKSAECEDKFIKSKFKNQMPTASY